jgi:hypothetical protein
MARARREGGRSRWDEDNRLALNPWAFLAVGALVGTLAGLALLLSLL